MGPPFYILRVDVLIFSSGKPSSTRSAAYRKTTSPEDCMAYSSLVIRLGYRGAGFVGFAPQPGQRSVASELCSALETLLRREVNIECAGRTDAGVHALSQYVSLPLMPDEMLLSPQKLFGGLVALTPDDIAIQGLYRAPEGFSARFDALERSYRYRISCGRSRPIMSWDHVWWLRSQAYLDVEAMNQAAQALVGEHDFVSFCKALSAKIIQDDGRSTSRNLSKLSVSRVSEAGESLIAIDVSGNAFLHNMVRIITGSLVEVGSGRRDQCWIQQALDAHDRKAAGPTAPATGLCFESVRYPEGLLIPWEN